MEQLTARVEKTIHAPISEVWRALTDSKKLKRFFFGADIETDWKVGSPIKMRGEFKGKPYEDRGQILIDEPLHILSFTHFSPLLGKPDAPENYHVVTIVLDPESDLETHVELMQSNLTGGITVSDEKNRADYEKNWKQVLDGLENLFIH
jgi:uncharacterized protein YndB with AHSA1/START domain